MRTYVWISDDPRQGSTRPSCSITIRPPAAESRSTLRHVRAMRLGFPLLDIASFPRTFAVSDADGTLLLQLDTLIQL
jgi:hypothetical protein